MEMTYKLLAVDIDGTLLSSKGMLSDENRKAVRLAVQQGVMVTLSTGRPIQGVGYINDMLDLDAPFITYNGAMVITSKSKEVLFEQRLSAKNAKLVTETGKRLGTTQVVWAENKLYVTEKNEKTDFYRDISEVEPILVDDFDEAIQNGVTKILWYDDIEKIEKFQSEVGESLNNEIVFHTSRSYFLEFVDSRASKAIAMEKIGERFGIKQSEMIAVGDGYNDLSMIEYAGLGVAMENANDEIKKTADYITLSNDEDGVAHVIYKFILKG
jgi:hypothetical protein